MTYQDANLISLISVDRQPMTAENLQLMAEAIASEEETLASHFKAYFGVSPFNAEYRNLTKVVSDRYTASIARQRMLNERCKNLKISAEMREQARLDMAGETAALVLGIRAARFFGVNIMTNNALKDLKEVIARQL